MSLDSPGGGRSLGVDQPLSLVLRVPWSSAASERQRLPPGGCFGNSGARQGSRELCGPGKGSPLLGPCPVQGPAVAPQCLSITVRRPLSPGLSHLHQPGQASQSTHCCTGSVLTSVSPLLPLPSPLSVVVLSCPRGPLRLTLLLASGTGYPFPHAVALN